MAVGALKVLSSSAGGIVTSVDACTSDTAGVSGGTLWMIFGGGSPGHGASW